MLWRLMMVGMLYGSIALAQAPPHNMVSLEPVEREGVSCRWERTLTGGSATVVLRGVPAKPDATPSGIIVAGPTANGNLLTVTLAPDTGCGASGCRNGNQYQVKLLATDTDLNQVSCNFLLKVKSVVLQP